jgi:hypothetical protein
LTSLRALPGFARWSPDGGSLTFHSDPEGHPDVLVVPASGGRPRIVTPGPLAGGYPSYSRDGQWIYFSGPNAQGQLRVWKIPAAGGTPIQVTPGVGALAIESYDGRDLYFLEVGERPSALWRLSTSGGHPTKVLEGVVNASFDVAEGGIYYIDRVDTTAPAFAFESPSGEARLQYFDFATRHITTVTGRLGRVSLGVSTSRDGRTVFFSRVDSSADELMLVDGLP